MVQENVRLRLEAADGSATKEYRIDDGKVEVRSLHSHSGYDPPESSWHRLTPQQLSTHVECNTVVAQWFKHGVLSGERDYRQTSERNRFPATSRRIESSSPSSIYRKHRITTVR